MELKRLDSSNKFRPGDFINQAAILNSKTRHLSGYKLQVTGENAVIAVLNHSDFLDSLHRLHQVQLDKIIQFLKEVPGFQLMSKTAFRKLINNFTCERVQPGWVF
jgi:hypothetical protein